MLNEKEKGELAGRWWGEWTDELDKLYIKYEEIFYVEPDGYEEICYEALTYDEYVKAIKESLKSHRTLPKIIK